MCKTNISLPRAMKDVHTARVFGIAPWLWYQGILADIAAIKADKVTDTVSASSPEFPYSQHTVTVQGVPAGWRSQRLSELYRDKAQIELYIESAEDDTVRAIMRYRIKQGFSWGQVAARMGYSLSEQQIKRRYYGAFEK